MLDADLGGKNGCIAAEVAALGDTATEPTARDRVDPHAAALQDDWERVCGADAALDDAERALAAGLAGDAAPLIADAITLLDRIGATEPERTEPRHLGSRLLAALRALQGFRDAEMDALIARP